MDRFNRRHVLVWFVVISAAFGTADVSLRGQGTRGGQARQKETQVNGITGTRQVQQALDRVRAAVGGAPALAAVRSLRFEYQRVLHAPNVDPEHRTRLLLLPDRYRETTSYRYGETTRRVEFVVNGDQFSRLPPGGDQLDSARRNVVGYFAEVTLTLLLRAPSVLPVHATLQQADVTKTRTITFTGPGDFARTVEIDASTGRLRGFNQSAIISGSGGQAPAVRSVTFDEYQKFGSIWLPVRMTEQIANVEASITLADIVINKDVTPDDFIIR